MSFATCGVAVAVSATIARASQVARRVGEAEVVGTEVVAPLRDAVRLVDDEQAEPRALDLLARSPGEAKRSGATYSSRSSPRDGALERRAVLRRGLLRVDERRRGPARSARSASTWSCISETSGETTIVRSSRISAGQLVAERLAGAGRHHDERVAVGQRGVDRLRLTGPEAVEAEVGAQRFAGVHGTDDHSAGIGRDRSAARGLRKRLRAYERQRALEGVLVLPAGPCPAAGTRRVKQASQCVSRVAADRLVDAREREVVRASRRPARRRSRRRCARARPSPRASTCRSRSGRGGGSAAR